MAGTNVMRNFVEQIVQIVQFSDTCSDAIACDQRHSGVLSFGIVVNKRTHVFFGEPLENSNEAEFCVRLFSFTSIITLFACGVYAITGHWLLVQLFVRCERVEARLFTLITIVC
jgi:hypothetical protein